MTEENNIIVWEDIRYHHFGLGSGYCTIAYRLDNNRENELRHIEYASAFTSPEDTFSKKIGRNISKGRLEKYPKYIEFHHRKDINQSLIYQVVQLLRYEVINDKATPSWKNKYKIIHRANGLLEIIKDAVIFPLETKGYLTGE